MMWRHMIKFQVIALLLIVLQVSCGGGSVGGTEAGNPPSTLERSVIGSVPSATQNRVTQLLGVSLRADACAADRVIATNVSGDTVMADVSSSCTLQLVLPIDTAYSVSFVKNDAFIASMIFNNNPNTFASSYFVVSAGASPIDFGAIVFVNGVATPAVEPATQNDYDDDGVSDYDDDDDDEDGLSDEHEEDCDLNGLINDYDDPCEDESDGDNGNDEDEEVTATLLEVEPRNDRNLTDDEELVSLNETVQARFNCNVDFDSVTAFTFSIVATADTIECVYDVSDSGETIRCEHDDDPFLPDTTYTATLDGVTCDGGVPISAVSWSWKTEAEDD